MESFRKCSQGLLHVRLLKPGSGPRLIRFTSGSVREFDTHNKTGTFLASSASSTFLLTYQLIQNHQKDQTANSDSCAANFHPSHNTHPRPPVNATSNMCTFEVNHFTGCGCVKINFNASPVLCPIAQAYGRVCPEFQCGPDTRKPPTERFGLVCMDSFEGGKCKSGKKQKKSKK